jgi:hypothetical protein
MEKIFVGNGRIIETKFGKVPKGSMSKDDINKIVKYMKDNNLDWINWEMLEKKPENKVEGKPTHYIQIDTWKPEKKETKDSNDSLNYDMIDSDDLPF